MEIKSNELMTIGKGSRTYGLCALGLAIVGAVSAGWIQLDPKLYDELKTAIVFAAIAALRAGVQR